MNDENKSIHEFDFELICEYFSNLERQGPGSPELTIKAVSDLSIILTTNHLLLTLAADQVDRQWY